MLNFDKKSIATNFGRGWMFIIVVTAQVVQDTPDNQ